MLAQIHHTIKSMFKMMIRLYQHTISFDHGLLRFMYPNGFCRYYPTCSEYAYQAIDKKGMLKGSFLIGKRLLRCNPWSKGGIDELG